MRPVVVVPLPILLLCCRPWLLLLLLRWWHSGLAVVKRSCACSQRRRERRLPRVGAGGGQRRLLTRLQRAQLRLGAVLVDQLGRAGAGGGGRARVIGEQRSAETTRASQKRPGPLAGPASREGGLRRSQACRAANKHPPLLRVAPSPRATPPPLTCSPGK
jgi:hypothetical protein